ncbi:hypothetical protein OROGR_007946 [Orobanche gracilis]
MDGGGILWTGLSAVAAAARFVVGGLGLSPKFEVALPWLRVEGGCGPDEDFYSSEKKEMKDNKEGKRLNLK